MCQSTGKLRKAFLHPFHFVHTGFKFSEVLKQEEAFLFFPVLIFFCFKFCDLECLQDRQAFSLLGLRERAFTLLPSLPSGHPVRNESPPT